jgi:hypothetical protein
VVSNDGRELLPLRKSVIVLVGVKLMGGSGVRG